jgi:uncharacterized membrane protein YhiD involved in acid resistance
MTAPHEPSLGELVSTATRDLSTLIRTEVQLAKVEIKREVTAAGKGAGLFGGAGLGIGLGWGFFIVGMLYLVAAAVLAFTGKKSIEKVGPPEKTIETVKDDIAWAKNPTQAPTTPSRS